MGTNLTNKSIDEMYDAAHALHLGLNDVIISYNERKRQIYNLRQAVELLKMRCNTSTKEGKAELSYLIKLSCVMALLQDMER